MPIKHSENKPHLLKLVDYHHPVLHKAAETISFPLSEEDRSLINDMRFSIQKEQLKAVDAPWDAAAGMAANQWGVSKRIFLYCPEADAINNLEVIINPSYEPLKPFKNEQDWEACFSVPLACGKIQRYTHIRATYQNETGETIVRELEGFYARVWQHETDHLNGFLYDNPLIKKCIAKRMFTSRESIDEFYNLIREERKKEFGLNNKED